MWTQCDAAVAVDAVDVVARPYIHDETSSDAPRRQKPCDCETPLRRHCATAPLRTAGGGLGMDGSVLAE